VHLVGFIIRIQARVCVAHYPTNNITNEGAVGNVSCCITLISVC